MGVFKKLKQLKTVNQDLENAENSLIKLEKALSSIVDDIEKK